MSKPPLELPEILAIVLEYVEFKSLVNAAQVNHLWAELATSLIWRGVPYGTHSSFSEPLRKLVHLPQERRDWYSKKIIYLELDDDRENRNDPDLLPIIPLLRQHNFSFPNIKSLVVDCGSRDMTEQRMARFLQPSLLCIKLYGGSYTRWFLEQAELRSPLLRIWSVNNWAREFQLSPEMTSANFFDFLTRMPSIKHLELVIGWQSVLNQNLMLYLMTRPGLERLSLQHETPLLLNTLLKATINHSIVDIFQHMRCFEVHAEERALRLVLPSLSRLQRVYITLVDPPIDPQDHILGYLIPCSQLEEIALSCDFEVTIPSSTLLSIASNCTFLRKLEIAYHHQCDDDFTDDFVEKLASKLVNIELLALPQAVNLTTKALISLGRHCPRLQTLRLLTSFEITDLDNEQEDIVFRRLGGFELRRFTLRPEESDLRIFDKFHHIASVLDKWFPSLYMLEMFPLPRNGPDLDLQRLVRRHVSGKKPRDIYSVWVLRLPIALTECIIEGISGTKYSPFP